MVDEREVPVSRIVVIGGSSTGLLAAAALAGPGRDVTVVERDVFPDAARPRAGVPQGNQAHVFLYRGLGAAEELLPGLRQDLLLAGAVPVNGGQLLWLTERGWLPTRSGYEVLSATRPLLEQVIRRRTLDLAHVTSRSGARVVGLDRDDSGWAVQLDDGSTLEADLVVDASGRGSRLPHWLADLGVPVPAARTVDARVGYATRIYRDGPPALAGCAGIVIAATPERPVGALALPAENGSWIVSAIGLGEQRPPRDNDAFESFLADLADPALSDLVAQCQPVTDVAVYRQTANLRHPYERVLRWPHGLLVAGDALCAFNPVYGQGITVGALQALELRRAARRGLRPSGCGRLQRQLATTVNTPWSIATSTDRSFPTADVGQSRLQALLGAWSGELATLSIHGNRRASDSMSRVYNLLDPPLLLLHPALVAAAVSSRLLGHGPVTPRPAVLDQLGRASVTAGRP